MRYRDAVGCAVVIIGVVPAIVLFALAKDAQDDDNSLPMAEILFALATIWTSLGGLSILAYFMLRNNL